jgi:hypothetical protein
MSRLADIGVALYKTLLALYPCAFRRQFAFDMIHDFEDASREAFAKDRWRGVMSLYLFIGADVLRSLPLQWLRSGALIITLVALVSAAFCAVVLSVLDLRVPYTMSTSSPERDGVLLLIVATTILVVIAATIVFSLMFLRPAFTRHAGRRRV